MTSTTDAIILSYIRYRDYDRLYTVYTREFGKLAILARGANKITSKLASHLEIGNLSRLMVASGRGFDILAQARARQSFANIRLDSARLTIALALVEMVDKLTEARHQDTEVFDLLARALFALSQNKEVIARDFLYHYSLRLLTVLGYAPNARRDAHILQSLLVADIGENGILVKEEARRVIDEYLRSALDEKQVYCFHTAVSARIMQKV